MKSKNISIKTKSYVSKKSKSNHKMKKIEFSLNLKNISIETKNQRTRARKIKLLKIYYNIIFIFIISLISIIKGYNQLLLLNDSYIKFKIKPNNNIKLFYINNITECKNTTIPSIIEFNRTNYTNISFNYQIISKLEEEEIKLIWKNDNEPKSTDCLFQGCSNITNLIYLILIHLK